MEKINLFSVIKETILIFLGVILNIKLPLYILEPLNNQFRDWFNPPGSIVIKPHLRVISALVCFVITSIPVFILLRYGKATKTLHIIALIINFLCCGILSYAIYVCG